MLVSVCTLWAPRLANAQGYPGYWTDVCLATDAWQTDVVFEDHTQDVRPLCLELQGSIAGEDRHLIGGFGYNAYLQAVANRLQHFGDDPLGYVSWGKLPLICSSRKGTLAVFVYGTSARAAQLCAAIEGG
jgi:hypothetical protein